MRPTIIVWLFITGLVLFASITYFMYSLTNSSIWQGMCNSDWEDGFMMIVIPFAVLFFALALIKMVYEGWKGPPPGGGQE